MCFIEKSVKLGKAACGLVAPVGGWFLAGPLHCAWRRETCSNLCLYQTSDAVFHLPCLAVQSCGVAAPISYIFKVHALTSECLQEQQGPGPRPTCILYCLRSRSGATLWIYAAIWTVLVPYFYTFSATFQIERTHNIHGACSSVTIEEEQ